MGTLKGGTQTHTPAPEYARLEDDEEPHLAINFRSIYDDDVHTCTMMAARFVPGSPSGMMIWQILAARFVTGSPSGIMNNEKWLGKRGCTLCAWHSGSPSCVKSLELGEYSVAAHSVPGSPSGVIRAWQVWLHILCLAALQALSELGKCGCTFCAWQPFRRYQSFASVAAHYVPGCPTLAGPPWQPLRHN